MAEQRNFLSAVHRFLATMENHANFLHLRDEQYENCRLRIQQWPSMPMETITEVVGLVAGLPFTPDQLSQLQLDVSQKIEAVQPVPQSAKGGRRPQQNYQSFTNYLTNSLWLLVLGDNPLVNALLVFWASWARGCLRRRPAVKLLRCFCIELLRIWTSRLCTRCLNM